MLDFLVLPLRSDGAVVREGREFVVKRPWGVARYGGFFLKPGWWMLESVSEECVELRLASATDPLIVITHGYQQGHSNGVRFYLPKAETFEVSILLSPWPGRRPFEKLRFRRMTAIEILGLVGNSTARLVRTSQPVEKIGHVVRQVIERRPIGFRTASADSNLASNASMVRFAGSSPTLPTRLVRHGDLHALLGVDDTLDSRALELVAREFQRSPAVKVVYCDVRENDVIVPRPLWTPELAPWFEIHGTPQFFRAESTFIHTDPNRWLNEAIAAGGADSIARIPLPLVRRPKGHWPVLPTIPVPRLDRHPKVSVIIPTKYRIDLLEKCLGGLVRRTKYPDLEVVVVDNGADHPRLAAVLKEASQHLKLIHIMDNEEFNFSRLVNLGAKHSSGEILLLLNDDVEPIHVGWLHRIVHSAIAPDTGAVGARLLYPDRSIQHAGVAMGIGGVCGHLWRGLEENDAIRCPYVVYPSERMAVTGACLAVRREVFDGVGGLDEAAFPVSLNDIDFCLRVRAAGFRNIYRGDAVLIHFESQSRGSDAANMRSRRRLAKEIGVFLARWRSLLDDDPFGSPMFDPRTESGAVHYAALNLAA